MLQTSGEEAQDGKHAFCACMSSNPWSPHKVVCRCVCVLPVSQSSYSKIWKVETGEAPKAPRPASRAYTAESNRDTALNRCQVQCSQLSSALPMAFM